MRTDFHLVSERGKIFNGRSALSSPGRKGITAMKEGTTERSVMEKRKNLSESLDHRSRSRVYRLNLLRRSDILLLWKRHPLLKRKR